MTDLTMSIDDFSKRILQPSMSILAAAIDVEFQAAARIQSIEAELDRVRGALKSFARDAERLTTISDDERLAFTDAHGNAILYVSITAGDIKTARQALSPGEE